MRCPVGSGALAALAVGTCIFQFGSNPCHAGDERHGREEKCQEARLDCTAVSMPRRPRSFKVRRSRRIESCLKVNLSSLHLSTREGREEEKVSCGQDRLQEKEVSTAQCKRHSLPLHCMRSKMKMQPKGSVCRCPSIRTIIRVVLCYILIHITLRVVVVVSWEAVKI